MTAEPLDVAIRAWAPPPPKDPATDPRLRTEPQLPGRILVFDCESTIDATQSLTFGSWRYYDVVSGQLVCLDEGLFHADDLEQTDPDGFATLQDYARSHTADTTRGSRRLRVISRAEFTNRVFHSLAYKARAAVVGFNLPFDISRLAVDVGDARGRNRGGFSFILHHGTNGHSERRHRPRVVIRTLAPNRTVIEFTRRLNPDTDDFIPHDSTDGKPDPNYVWRGQFIDLRTLVFSLTAELLSLNGACERFGVTGKNDPASHGVITSDYIDYNRRDVAATAELYQAVITEFARHPVQLAAHRAFSPASIAKAYLRAMNITPPLQKNPAFPDDVMGFAMASFYGGRTECRIRKTPVPVTLVDFTSMYPTVDALMGMWGSLTAERIDTVDDTDRVIELLDTVELDDCFDPQFWPQLNAIVQIRPDGDLVPVRARFDGETYTTGVNPLHSDEPFWYPLADCVASTLLTGRPPDVLQAIRFTAHGQQPNLRSVRLRGDLPVDPATDDFFTTIVEQRNRTRHDDHSGAASQFLKTLVNSGSYGIHIELQRHPLPKGKVQEVTVHGRHDEPFTAKVHTPEHPGPWFFAPHATVITGAARLMLAMLQRCVTDADGTYAFCDTDSMAIVTRQPGDHTTGPAGISRQRITAIQQRFNKLNPYATDAVPQLLKTEARGTCYSIASKRYAIYDATDTDIHFDSRHKYSEHGLGHLQNPDPTGEPWIRQYWKHTLRQVHGLPSTEPDWYDLPALARTTLTTTTLLHAITQRELHYRDRVKPFNFLTTAPAARPPAGASPATFRLVAAWEPDPSLWPNHRFHNTADQGDTSTYSVSTDWTRPDTAPTDSYRDYLKRHQHRPEHKATSSAGPPMRTATGSLQPRRALPLLIRHIGKEASQGSAAQLSNLVGYGPGDTRVVADDIVRRLTAPGFRRVVADASGYSDRQLRRIANATCPVPERLIAIALPARLLPTDSVATSRRGE